MRSKDEAVRLSESGKCLGCDKSLAEKENVRRGLCVACYSAATAAKRAGTITLDQLVAKGLMLPKTKGGRKKGVSARSALTKFIASQQTGRKANKE